MNTLWRPHHYSNINKQKILVPPNLLLNTATAFSSLPDQSKVNPTPNWVHKRFNYLLLVWWMNFSYSMLTKYGQEIKGMECVNAAGHELPKYVFSHQWTSKLNNSLLSLNSGLLHYTTSIVCYICQTIQSQIFFEVFMVTHHHSAGVGVQEIVQN